MPTLLKQSTAKRNRRHTPAGVYAGLDIRRDEIVLIALDLKSAPVRVAAPGLRIPIQIDDTRERRECVIAAIKKAVDELGLHDAPCILSGRATDVKVGGDDLDPKIKGPQAVMWATLQVKEKSGWAQEDNIVDVEPAREPNQRIYGWTQSHEVTHAVEMAKSAGLRPIAFDAPMTAWQRLMENRSQAVLDLSAERPCLFVFGSPVGQAIPLPSKMTAEALGREVIAQLAKFRLDQIFIRSIAIYGSYSETKELIAELETDPGLDPQVLSFGTGAESVVDPFWAFANALATWAHPSAIGMRVNLIPKNESGTTVFGHQFSKNDLLPALLSLGMAAATVFVFSLTMDAKLASIQAQTTEDRSQIQAIRDETNNDGLLQSNVIRLKQVDQSAYWLRYSGQLMALRLVALGNAIPNNAYATKLTQGLSGWEVDGTTTDIQAMASAQDRIAKTSPGLNVTMLKEDVSNGIFSFAIKVTDPPATPTPYPATSPTASSTGAASTQSNGT